MMVIWIKFNVFVYLLAQDTEWNIQLTVFTDRCQGGTSLQSGSLELMVKFTSYEYITRISVQLLSKDI